MKIVKIRPEEAQSHLDTSGLISASKPWSDFVCLHFGAIPDFVGVFGADNKLKFILPVFISGKALEAIPKFYTQMVKVGTHAEPEPWNEMVDFLKSDKKLSSVKLSICFVADDGGHALDDKYKRGVAHILKSASNDGKEILVKYVDKKTRNQIKTAYERGGFKVCVNQDVDAFYALYCRSIKRLKSIAKSKKYFQDLKICFGDNFQIINGLRDGKLAGANLILLNRNHLHLPFSVSDSVYFKDYINDFIYWETIKYGLARGVKIFDFGPSVLKDVSHQHFKEGFGARPVPIYKISHYNSISSRLADFVSVKARNLRLKLNKAL